MRALPVACICMAVFAIADIADAFTSSASCFRTVTKPSVDGKSMLYLHMGDLDHDDLPEDNFFPNPSTTTSTTTSEGKDETSEVVLYDNVAVALNDEAYGLAMKSIMAVFVAVAVAFGGAGFLKPRPVLAVEPMTFSTRENIQTVVFRSEEC